MILESAIFESVVLPDWFGRGHRCLFRFDNDKALVFAVRDGCDAKKLAGGLRSLARRIDDEDDPGCNPDAPVYWES